uniref:Solute carrier family 13 member 4 n=1 Tax=Neolamprologus brichardi TaxID=32507 RepID=A0A3Q4HQK5_NEOBR
MVTAVYWVSEAVPLGAAALVPAFLYPLFGVLKSSEVAAEYCKDTTLLLMGVICLAASIEKWNLHKRIALRMVMIAGAKPGMLVLGFMCCTVFLSMWLSNTSTTAMVMPIAEAVLQQLICTGLADSHNDSETDISWSKMTPRFLSVTGGQGNPTQNWNLVRYHISNIFRAKYKNLSFI